MGFILDSTRTRRRHTGEKLNETDTRLETSPSKPLALFAKQTGVSLSWPENAKRQLQLHPYTTDVIQKLMAHIEKQNLIL
jgi:hypothetical protein